MAEGGAKDSAGRDGSCRDVPPLSKDAEVCSPISTFQADYFRSVFSNRALDRGSLFAMEGFVGKVEVCTEDNGCVTIRGQCFASFQKKVVRRVEVQLGADLHFLSSSCPCTAGQNKCSHAAGVLWYVTQLCRHIRVADGPASEDEQDDGVAGEETPCTSKPRAWGLPAQKGTVTPDVPMEEVNFSGVSLAKDFFATIQHERADPRVKAMRKVWEQDVDTLLGKLKTWSESSGQRMALLDYVDKEQEQDDELPPSCPFDQYRPAPIRFPPTACPSMESAE